MSWLTVVATAYWFASEKGYRFCPVKSSSTIIADRLPISVPGGRVLYGLGAGAAAGATSAADRLGNKAFAEPTRLSEEMPSELDGAAGDGAAFCTTPGALCCANATAGAMACATVAFLAGVVRLAVAIADVLGLNDSAGEPVLAALPVAETSVAGIAPVTA